MFIHVFMCVYIYIYIYIYTYIHTYTHIYIYIYIHIYVSAERRLLAGSLGSRGSPAELRMPAAGSLNTHTA